MLSLATLLYHDVYRRSSAESGFQDEGSHHYKLPINLFDEHLSRLAEACPEGPVLVSQLPQDIDKSLFAMSFDDGGLSYYSLIADRLEAFGWRGHCLVTSGQIGQKGFLSKCQIRELHERGHVVGTHTVSHPERISECDWPMLLSEWRSSKACLEDIIGAEVSVGSVPGGYYSPRVAEATSAAGIRFLFTSEPETRVRKVDTNMVLGRFTLRAGNSSSRALAIVKREWPSLASEWVTWNCKKVLKKTLGDNYRRLAALSRKANGEMK